MDEKIMDENDTLDTLFTIYKRAVGGSKTEQAKSYAVDVSFLRAIILEKDSEITILKEKLNKVLENNKASMALGKIAEILHESGLHSGPIG